MSVPFFIWPWTWSTLDVQFGDLATKVTFIDSCTGPLSPRLFGSQSSFRCLIGLMWVARFVGEEQLESARFYHGLQVVVLQ